MATSMMRCCLLLVFAHLLFSAPVLAEKPQEIKDDYKPKADEDKNKSPDADNVATAPAPAKTSPAPETNSPSPPKTPPPTDAVDNSGDYGDYETPVPSPVGDYTETPGSPSVTGLDYDYSPTPTAPAVDYTTAAPVTTTVGDYADYDTGVEEEEAIPSGWDQGDLAVPDWVLSDVYRRLYYALEVHPENKIFPVDGFAPVDAADATKFATQSSALKAISRPICPSDTVISGNVKNENHVAFEYSAPGFKQQLWQLSYTTDNRADLTLVPLARSAYTVTNLERLNYTTLEDFEFSPALLNSTAPGPEDANCTAPYDPATPAQAFPLPSPKSDAPYLGPMSLNSSYRALGQWQELATTGFVEFTSSPTYMAARRDICYRAHGVDKNAARCAGDKPSPDKDYAADFTITRILRRLDCEFLDADYGVVVGEASYIITVDYDPPGMDPLNRWLVFVKSTPDKSTVLYTARVDPSSQQPVIDTETVDTSRGSWVCYQTYTPYFVAATPMNYTEEDPYVLAPSADQDKPPLQQLTDYPEIGYVMNTTFPKAASEYLAATSSSVVVYSGLVSAVWTAMVVLVMNLVI